MACLDSIPELGILQPSQWSWKPLISGFIPLMWTTGSYDKLAQGGNPWFGLVYPTSFRWFGSSLELSYFPGGVQYGGCYVTFPPVTVKIHQSCNGGFHQFFVEVFAGKRRFTRNLWNVPGSWMLTNDVLTHDQSPFCSDKYFKGSSIKEMDIRVLAAWLDLMRNNSISSSGVAPAWFTHIMSSDVNTKGMYDICDGCFYGLLPRPNSPSISTIGTVIGLLPKVSFPVREADLPAYVQECTKGAIVIEADLSYTVYMQLKKDCGAPWLISGSGFISPTCVISDDDELPPDNDPRWSPKITTTRISCVRVSEGIWWYPVDRWREGLYEASGAPRDYQYDYIRVVVCPNGSWTQESAIKIGVVVQEVTTYSVNTDGVMSQYSLTLVRNAMEQISTLDLRDCSTGAWGYNGRASIDALVTGKLAQLANTACGELPPGDYPLAPPPPIPKWENKGNKGEKCYVAGAISIGLLGSMNRKLRVGDQGTVDRAYNIVAPVVRSEVTSGLGIPTSLRVPFKFRLPTGTLNSGDMSAYMIGTLLHINYKGNIHLINLEEIFAYYNFAQSVLGFLVPGKIDVVDMRAFCE